jgi:hypothetical protein
MQWLLESSAFMTRNQCGSSWTPDLVLFYQISNFIIFLSIIEIVLSILFVCIKRKADLPAPNIFFLFVVFIFLCGLTHLADVIVFYWAPYRLFAVLSGLTAVASAITAFNLPLVVRTLVNFPSEETLRRTLIERELAKRNEALKARVASLEAMLKANAERTLEDLLRTNKWIHERTLAMQELQKLLSELEAI